MRCSPCSGIGWLRREVPHPYTAEHKPVTVARICDKCHGTGHVDELQVDNKAPRRGCQMGVLARIFKLGAKTE